MAWISRLYFALVAAVAMAVVASGAACTRWGQPGPITPTVAPLSALYVDPTTGSDSTGNGSSTKPYRTLTKAVDVLASSKSLSSSGVTIYCATGDYTASSGELFPIVVPTAVTITGTNFGSGTHGGTYIDGVGEDTLLETLIHAPAHSNYTTLEVSPGASLSLGDVYVGAAKLTLPNSHASYASFDVLGTLTAATSVFGAGVVPSTPYAGGLIVPGGSLTCSSCEIHGNEYGVGAFAVPVASASPPSVTGPSVTLSHSTGDSIVASRLADVLTDGIVDVEASGVTFEQARYAFADALRPVVSTTSRGILDFGGGASGSTGGNIFIGARDTEIEIVRRYETASALDDTWNPNQQSANRSGVYTRQIRFAAGAAGKNVTIRNAAEGSTVTVGPAVVPTPTPTSSPSSTPSP